MSDKSRDKKYWWMRLKENFFEEEQIDWLLEQKNGKDYCIFYMKLCLKSLKNEGVLLRKIGDYYIPYDIDKIAEFTKFDRDTVVVAIELLKKIGLISIESDGAIYMNQVDELIGVSTKKADDMRIARKKQKLELASQRIVPLISVAESIPDVSVKESATLSATNVAQSLEFRDKSIEITCIHDVEKKKIDPLSNDTLTFFKNEYKKVFLQSPYLQRSECDKLLELKTDFDDMLKRGLIDEYKDFKETIPIVLKRLKKVDFSNIKFIPRSSWLFKDTNYSKLMNNEFGEEASIETIVKKLRETEEKSNG